LEEVLPGTVKKIPTDLMREIWNNVEEKRYVELSTQIKAEGIMEKKHIDTLLSSLVTRQNFYYSHRHMFNYVINCLCYSRRLKRMSNRFSMRPHYLFKRGTKKLDSELDIVGIARAQEKNRVLKNIIMNKGQQLLFNFQRKTILESESSDGTDNLDYQDLLEHETPLIRIFTLQKMKKAVETL